MKLFSYFYNYSIESHSAQRKSTSESVVKVKYTDIYVDESCQRGGQCSHEQGYRIPDQCKRTFEGEGKRIFFRFKIH